MSRKSPVRHKVKSHTRRGKLIKSFTRGSGDRSQDVRKSRVIGEISIPDQEELLIEWKKKQFKYMKDAIERIGEVVPDEKIQQSVDKDAEKVQRILRDGLDVGGIIRTIEEVTLKKYKDDIYFKTDDKGLYKVSRYV